MACLIYPQVIVQDLPQQYLMEKKHGPLADLFNFWGQRWQIPWSEWSSDAWWIQQNPGCSQEQVLPKLVFNYHPHVFAILSLFTSYKLPCSFFSSSLLFRSFSFLENNSRRIIIPMLFLNMSNVIFFFMSELPSWIMKSEKDPNTSYSSPWSKTVHSWRAIANNYFPLSKILFTHDRKLWKMFLSR